MAEAPAAAGEVSFRARSPTFRFLGACPEQQIHRKWNMRPQNKFALCGKTRSPLCPGVNYWNKLQLILHRGCGSVFVFDGSASRRRVSQAGKFIFVLERVQTISVSHVRWDFSSDKIAPVFNYYRRVRGKTWSRNAQAVIWIIGRSLNCKQLFALSQHVVIARLFINRRAAPIKIISITRNFQSGCRHFVVGLEKKSFDKQSVPHEFRL